MDAPDLCHSKGLEDFRKLDFNLNLKNIYAFNLC